MPRVLLAWIGHTDLKAGKGDASVGAGPIAQALEERSFDHIVLLNTEPKADAATFERWLEKKTSAAIVVRHERLTSPTHYPDIYRAAAAAASEALKEHGPGTKLTFHLSPGTPAMAAVWILISPQFDAALIQSSRQKGVEDANIPFDISAEFIPAVARRADEGLARLSAGLRPEEPTFGDIVYRSEVMARLEARARAAAPLSATILIEGESGTGKELLAAAIHKVSLRSAKPFVVVNCGAIPENLVESEFFGHTKGAFTGATHDHVGYFEQAADGTIFLDEVGELPREAQVKLLRVLNDKKVRPVGAKAHKAIDIRVIAATNRDLAAEVRAGRFREDLYYRLAALVLRTPPLCAREGDVGLLCERVIGKLNAEASSRGAAQKKLSAGARKLLLKHPWPGNVRELEAVLLRAFVWSRATNIEEDDVREALAVAPSAAAPEILGRPLGNGFSLKETLAEVRRHYLTRAMAETNDNMSEAAKLVGLPSYKTFKNWLDKHQEDE